VRWWRSGAWANLAGGLALTPEEGFVLSLLESPTTAEEVVLLSGLPSERVEAILGLLLDKGLSESDGQPHRLASHTIPDLDEPSAALKARATLDSSEDITIERPAKREPPQAATPISVPPSMPPSAPPSGPPAVPRIAVGAMIDAYAMVAQEDTPHDTRESAREWIRSTFGAASPDARAAFLWESEGETLPALSHVPFDARVAKILCAKTITSPALASNLARCPTCPTSLLTHILRLPIARRLPQLRRALLHHPNMPAEIRRRG
jgi:hypothetical protein